MGSFREFLASRAGSALTGAAGTAAGGFFGYLQQQAQNRFNAEQAQINRDFQERMSNTAYQRGVSDMQKAGLNPALMYGGAGASGASSPSGSTASSSGFNAVADALSIAKLGEEIRGMHLENQGRELSNSYQTLVNRFYPSVQDATLQNLYKELDVKDADINDKNADANLKESQRVLAELESIWRPKLASAQTEQARSTAARELAEAAISRWEKELGHRLGNNALLTLATGLVSMFGLTPKEVGSSLKDKLLPAPHSETVVDESGDEKTVYKVGIPFVDNILSKMNSGANIRDQKRLSRRSK